MATAAGNSPSTPLVQPSLGTGTEEYTLPGVLYYLQDAFRDFERERNEWQIDKSDLESRIRQLETEKQGLLRETSDLRERVGMLGFALKQERLIQGKASTVVALDHKEEGVIDEHLAQDTNKASKSTTAYPTYSKGLAHVKSRELLKSYLREANQLLASSSAASSRLHKVQSRPSIQTETSVGTPSSGGPPGQEQQQQQQPVILLKSQPQPVRSRRAGSASSSSSTSWREEKKLWTPKGLFKASEVVAMTAQEAKDSDSSEDGDLSPDTPSTVSPTDTEVLLNSSNSSDIGTLSGGA